MIVVGRAFWRVTQFENWDFFTGDYFAGFCFLRRTQQQQKWFMKGCVCVCVWNRSSVHIHSTYGERKIWQIHRAIENYLREKNKPTVELQNSKI